MLFDGVAAAGGQCGLSPSGYVLVRETMMRRGPARRGAVRPRLFDDGWGGVDDAIYTAIQTFQAISRPARRAAGFRDSLPPSFATTECAFPVPRSRKAQVMAEVARRLTERGRHLRRHLRRADGVRRRLVGAARFRHEVQAHLPCETRPPRRPGAVARRTEAASRLSGIKLTSSGAADSNVEHHELHAQLPGQHRPGDVVDRVAAAACGPRSGRDGRGRGRWR